MNILLFYKSGYEVFKNYKLFGVYLKIIALRHNPNNLEAKNIKNKKFYYCNTHPHQIYFEFLSEHGLIGSIFIIHIFIN